jgi:hypothetical protein
MSSSWLLQDRGDDYPTPATSRKVILGEPTDIREARDLPKDITFEPPHGEIRGGSP